MESISLVPRSVNTLLDQLIAQYPGTSEPTARIGTVSRSTASIDPSPRSHAGLSAEIVALLAEGREQIGRATWTDGQIAQITDQDMAKLAFEKSDTLRSEFPTVGCFLAYWWGLWRKTR